MNQRKYARGYVYGIFQAKIYLDNGEVKVNDNLFAKIFFNPVWIFYSILCDVMNLENMFPVKIDKRDIDLVDNNKNLWIN